MVLGSQPHLGVRLRDPACADVFTALAEDVAPRVAAAGGAKQAAAELLGRLRRWQQFLTASHDELSVEAQRGLWGELHVLRTHLLPALGAAATVEGWKASAAAHQDFQFAGGAVEVKTTAAKQPQSVRITSERQLDDTGVGALFLHVVVVDEREVPAGGQCARTKSVRHHRRHTNSTFRRIDCFGGIQRPPARPGLAGRARKPLRRPALDCARRGHLSGAKWFSALGGN